jgi:hypothetical protein
MILLSDVEHGALIAQAAGVGFDPERDQCISRITGDGQFLGGTIYTGFNGAVIWCHVAGIEGWTSPELLWVSFDYPFMQLKVNQILATVSSKNEKMVDLIQRLGFKKIHTIKDGVVGGSLILYSMSKNQCRWLKLRSRYLKTNGHAGEFTHAHL